MIILHFHLQRQFECELFHIYFTSNINMVWRKNLWSFCINFKQKKTYSWLKYEDSVCVWSEFSIAEEDEDTVSWEAGKKAWLLLKMFCWCHYWHLSWNREHYEMRSRKSGNNYAQGRQVTTFSSSNKQTHGSKFILCTAVSYRFFVSTWICHKKKIAQTQANCHLVPCKILCIGLQIIISAHDSSLTYQNLKKHWLLLQRIIARQDAKFHLKFWANFCHKIMGTKNKICKFRSHYFCTIL